MQVEAAAELRTGVAACAELRAPFDSGARVDARAIGTHQAESLVELPTLDKLGTHVVLADLPPAWNGRLICILLLLTGQRVDDEHIVNPAVVRMVTRTTNDAEHGAGGEHRNAGSKLIQ
jgi:hypothetical protein